MKPTLLKLIFAGIFALTFACQTKSLEELAKKDSSTFFSNLDNSEKLLAHPSVLPVNMPEEIARQNKAKSIKRLQGYFAELCKDTKDFRLLNTYRKIGDQNQKILFLEYEFCTSGIVIMGYEIEEENVSLFSVWPMKKEEKPQMLFTDDKSW